MNNKNIAIDFDGVIANTDFAKVNFARSVLGLDVTERLMKERYFVELFGGEQGKTLYSCISKSIYHSEKMLKVPMVSSSRDGIAKLRKAGWTCIIVTSRSGSLKDDSSSAYWAWRFLQENKYEIEEENFINVNDNPENDNSKLDVCLSLNLHGLVDDDYSKILPIIDAGMKGYLFSTQTNSEIEKENPTFQGIRVNDWNDLVEILLSRPDVTG
jgi:hypothetical protein